MSFSIRGVNQHVITEDDYRLIQEMTEDLIHVIHEYHRSIGHFKDMTKYPQPSYQAQKIIFRMSSTLT